VGGVGQPVTRFAPYGGGLSSNRVRPFVMNHYGLLDEVMVSNYVLLDVVRLRAGALTILHCHEHPMWYFFVLRT